MPYIVQAKRDMLDPSIDNLHKALLGLEIDDESNNMEANLNYTITRLLRICYGESYGEMNDAVGLLACVILEHYRTVAAPYEDQKKFDNGDIISKLPTVEVAEVVVKGDPDSEPGC